MPSFNPKIYQLELWSCPWNSTQLFKQEFPLKACITGLYLHLHCQWQCPLGAFPEGQAKLLSKGHILTADGDALCSTEAVCIRVWWVCMPRQYPAESCIILLWLCCWKHQIEIVEEPNRMVGWSWYTFHTLKHGEKVRRVSWGLRTCWGSVKGRTEQKDSDLVHRNSEKSLLDQRTSWAPSQEENW